MTSPLPQIQFFKSSDGNISLEVPIQNESVWLNEQQLSQLFDRERSTINRHIKSIFDEEELYEKSSVQKMHIPNSDKPVRFYNLDVIISVGYRVKSKKGVLFRQWANRVLKQYLIDGYVLNEARISKLGIENLQQAIDLLSHTVHRNKDLKSDDIEDIIHIIHKYSKAWDTLLRYDENRLDIPERDNEGIKALSIEDVRESIKSFKHELSQVNQATDIFGQEKDHQLESIISSIDQTFGGMPLYKSIEERAANLLYLIIKDHPFLDGNKRIGSFVFTQYLARQGKDPLQSQSLVALALLVAESNPKQKELVVQLIINLIINF